MESFGYGEQDTVSKFAWRLAVTIGTFLILLVALIGPVSIAHAQASGLKVTILRPGEGETLYSNPSTPFAAIPVTGLVSAEEFNTSQLQVRLEVIQGTKVFGTDAVTPQPDGSFSFDVGINSHPVSDLAELEQGCDSRCHSMQKLILPPGDVLLRATVSDPFGGKATAERSVIVDYAGYVYLPVQVVADDEDDVRNIAGSGRALVGVKVVANTRLLLWRAREFSAVTDSSGQATVYVERLAEAPTHYIIRLEPTVVDGIRVSSRNTISVTIPAGATNVEPVTVMARAVREEKTPAPVTTDSAPATRLTDQLEHLGVSSPQAVIVGIGLGLVAIVGAVIWRRR